MGIFVAFGFAAAEGVSNLVGIFREYAPDLKTDAVGRDFGDFYSLVGAEGGIPNNGNGAAVAHKGLFRGEKEGSGIVEVESGVMLRDQHQRGLERGICLDGFGNEPPAIPLSFERQPACESVFAMSGQRAFEMISVRVVPNGRAGEFILDPFAFDTVLPVGETAVEMIFHEDSVAVAFAFLKPSGIGFCDGGAMQALLAAVHGSALSVLFVVEPFSLVIVDVSAASLAHAVIVAMSLPLAVHPGAVVFAPVAVELIVHVAVSVWQAFRVHVALIHVSVFECDSFRGFDRLALVLLV